MRYFNAAGANAKAGLGEFHTPETHLIPLAIMAAINENYTLSLFGDDYPTADGTCVRDYIQVTDIADAHLDALQYLDTGGAPTEINVGTGQGYSVREVIDTVEKHTGKRVKVCRAPRRAGDPPVLVASGKKASQLLGWTPRHSNLEEMVSSAISGLENRDLYRD